MKEMKEMKEISSKDNEFIKHIKKLKDSKERKMHNEYIAEGIKLVKEAISHGVEIKQIIIAKDLIENGQIEKSLLESIEKYECICVTENVFKQVSDVKANQGILAVINKMKNSNEINLEHDIIVALDDIQDPGNLGTIIRTVDSIGLTQILVSKDTADAYNPKVIRSTMGAILRVNIIECEDLEKTLKFLQNEKYKIVVSSLQTDNSIYDIDYNKKIIVIGNEGKGIKESIQKISDEKIKIPMLGKSESLNASVATGVILYEYVRQKLNK